MLQIRIGPRKAAENRRSDASLQLFLRPFSVSTRKRHFATGPSPALPASLESSRIPAGAYREKLLFVCLARKKWEPFVDPHPTILRNAAKLLLGPNAPYTPPCFVHYKTEEKGTTDCFFPPFLFSHTPPPSPQNPLPSPGSPRRGFLARSPSGKPARLPRGASLKKMLARNYALGQPM